MSAHAIIAPSSLARTVQCPGSVVLSQKYAEAEGEHAIEGTAGHWVAYHYALTSMGLGAGLRPALGDAIHGGLKVDKEMIAGAEMYAEALEGFEGTAETLVAIPRVHAECSGTPDFWQYSEKTKTLRVADYKYGRRYVDVFENYQLIAYACGIIDELVASGRAVEFEIVVELMIVQPRCFHPDGPVRTWKTSATNLRPLINLAHTAAHLALGANPKTVSGPECLYCPARGDCKTAHVATTAILEYAHRAETMAQTGSEMGLRLLLINEALEMLKAVGSGLEEQIMSTLKGGKTVPYFKVGYSNPRETWNKPVAEVKMLGDMIGLKLTEETFAMTPKQAIKTGKIDRAVINLYSVTPNGAAKLVPDDSLKTARIFSA